MVPEHLKVSYDRRRKVFVNGKPAGFTNEIMKIGAGRNRVNLGDPPNYRPGERRIDIAGTTIVKPMEISFERVP